MAPNWGLLGPAAFDLAVTSGLHPSSHASVAADASRPAEDYEARKRTHLQTQQLCVSEGLQFVPLVVEASGGWAPIARRTWKELGQLLATKIGESEAVEIEQLIQSLVVSL